MKYCITINDKRYEVEVEKGAAAIVSTTEIPHRVIENKSSANVQTAATTIAPEVTKPEEQAAEASVESGKEVVKAPMGGAINDIKVQIGSAVKSGDTLLILEAMKMENEITTHVDGIVADIRVSKGAFVAADDILVIIK